MNLNNLKVITVPELLKKIETNTKRKLFLYCEEREPNTYIEYNTTLNTYNLEFAIDLYNEQRILDSLNIETDILTITNVLNRPDSLKLLLNIIQTGIVGNDTCEVTQWILFTKDPKVIETCGRVKAYCANKGWEIVKEKDSDQLKTIWTTFIGKDTSDYNRPRAKTETWKVINNVPVCFLEYDEYRTTYDGNGNSYQYHVHYICAHVFLKKPGAKRIFSKQIISKVKLKSDNQRTRK